MMSEFTIIIPARFGSTRLPGKPLLDLGGKTVLERVYRQAVKSKASRVVVATDDERIYEQSTGFGAETVMTGKDHESGTDRLQEVASELNLADDAIVVNVQGDEPLIPPEVINQVAANLATADASIATLCEPIEDEATAFDPNAVKVVFDVHGLALYFSRAPIPWNRDSFSGSGGSLPTAMTLYRHIGIYAYRVNFLHSFVAWGPSTLEQTESLEQLRAMYHGHRIHVEKAVATPPTGIDTQADLDAVRKLIASGEYD
ncbi:MAG: 3-deoxy-manno-octulosonate cytidylyltransferase [Pseudomonadales bacterium]|nr:3-deoxy-manno-octulosonate cytidylyltransferase [Pseudomonadales bacterium]